MNTAAVRRHAFDAAFALVTAAILAIAAAGVLAGAAPVLDTLAQFAGPGVALALVGGVAAALTRRPRLLAVLVAGGVVLGVQLIPQWFAQPARPAPGARPVRVYFVNLWTGNREGEAIARSIRACNPDVVALIEVSHGSEALLDPALSAYPYRRWDVPEAGHEDGQLRQLIASRLPLAPSGVEITDQLAVAEARVGGSSPFRLVLVHLSRPWPWHGQARQLDQLAARVRAGNAAQTVVVGDFNATVAGAPLARFARASGMSAASAPTGDWPTALPGFLRLAIENALAGKGLTLVHRRLAPVNGSDHQPVVVDVLPRARDG